jgi:hypothetical protein
LGKAIPHGFCEQENYGKRRDFLTCPARREKTIGLISLNGLHENGQMDMEHIIHSDYQNNDIDREALSMVIDYIFRATESKAIISNDDPDEKQNAPLYSLGSIDRNENGGQLIMKKKNWKK